jgi:uncharacterized damage-inducible protein DinB
MTWTAPEVEIADDGQLNAPERPLLEGYLRWHRSYLLHKCSGLTGEQLATASCAPSNLTLLGLIRHMAKVERRWFRERVAHEEVDAMYDPALGADADFEDLDPSRAEHDYARLVEQIRLAEEALARASYDEKVESRFGPMSVRSVVVHMIEEYAQHNGHADLLREAIDGVTDK